MQKSNSTQSDPDFEFEGDVSVMLGLISDVVQQEVEW